MYAAVGEQIVVRSRHQGETDRHGVILEVRGQDGAPPYLVRWASDGHEGLFYPQSDAFVAHAGSPSGSPGSHGTA
ncbi:MAG: hypothetical protein JWN35_56 [Frankiales bacterium]|jgi:hypothetical protein|nr:hypothetical protein [Frankiales bacterium]